MSYRGRRASQLRQAACQAAGLPPLCPRASRAGLVISISPILGGPRKPELCSLCRSCRCECRICYRQLGLRKIRGVTCGGPDGAEGWACRRTGWWRPGHRLSRLRAVKADLLADSPSASPATVLPWPGQRSRRRPGVHRIVHAHAPSAASACGRRYLLDRPGGTLLFGGRWNGLTAWRAGRSAGVPADLGGGGHLNQVVTDIR